MAKAIHKKPNPCGDLEKPIEDVRNMSMIVSSMDDTGGVEASTVTIDRRNWESLSFLVHRLDGLIRCLRA
jgi:hypothetical protein